MHAGAHTGVLERLKSNGLDPTPYTDQMHWAFRKLLGPSLSPVDARRIT